MNLKRADSIYVDGNSALKVLVGGELVWWKLPKGYQQCKYLSFNQQQSFEVSYCIYADDIVVSVSTNRGSHIYNTIWGARMTAELYYDGPDEAIKLYYSGAVIQSQEDVGGATRLTCQMLDNKYTGYWVGDYGAGNTKYMFAGMIYEFYVLRHGRIAILLIPCIDRNGTPCFFDVASGKTLYSSVNCGYELMDGTCVSPEPPPEDSIS